MLDRLDAEERLRLLLAGVLALLGLVIIFGFTAKQDPPGLYFVAGDGHYVAMAARSLALDGDLDLTNQYREFGDRWGHGRWPAQDGWRLPTREIGPALLMTPGLWLYELFGLSPAPYGTWLAIVPALTPALCFWLISHRLRRMAPEFPPSGSFVAAAVGVLAFVLPFYAWGRSAYPHACDALALSLFFWVALDERPRPVALGLTLALALLMRYQNLLWFAWPLIILAASEDKTRARRLPLTLALGLLGLSPVAYMALTHPGSEVGVIRWGADFFDLDNFIVDLADVLGGVHGLFRWTPIAALAGLGLLAWPTHRPQRAAFALIAGTLILLMATVKDPNAGTAFGARRLASLTPFVAWGVMGLWARRRGLRSRAALGALLLVLTLANLWRTCAAIRGDLLLAS